MMEETRETIWASFTGAPPNENRQKVTHESTAQVKTQEGKSQQLRITFTGPNNLWGVIYLFLMFSLEKTIYIHNLLPFLCL